MQPISKKQEARFRGPTSSKDFNKWVEDNYYDLVQLFNLGAENNFRLVSDVNMLVNENAALHKKILYLEETLDSIQSSLVSTSGQKVLSAVFTSTQPVVDTYQPEGSYKCEVNTKFGVIHAPLQQEPISKVYLTNANGENFLPETLKLRLYESILPFNYNENEFPQDKLVEDKELINAFDGMKNTYWQRTSVQPITTDEMYAVIEIEFPQNIINHLRVNNINLIPAPEFGFTILDIKYCRSGSWETLPTFPKTELEEISPIVDAERLSFVFPAQEATKLRIYIKQDNWELKDGNRVFVYGFKSVDICFTRFVDGEASTLIQFDIPNPAEHSFNTIESVEVISAKGGIKDSSLMRTELYVDKDGTISRSLGEVLDAGTKTVFIKTTLESRDSTSPTISQINITYTTS